MGSRFVLLQSSGISSSSYCLAKSPPLSFVCGSYISGKPVFGLYSSLRQEIPCKGVAGLASFLPPKYSIFVDSDSVVSVFSNFSLHFQDLHWNPILRRTGWKGSRRAILSKAITRSGTMSEEMASTDSDQGGNINNVVIGTGSVRQQLSELVKEALKATVPNDSSLEPIITICGAKFGDYQCNNAMGIWSKIKGQTTEFKNPNSVGQVAETRFASHTIVLRRLVRVKEALCQMVISNKWGGWKQADTEKAKIVKDLILSDDFWNMVEYALELIEPIMSMLRYANTNEPCLGNIYDARDSMLERMKSVIQRREQDPDTLYSKVEKIVLHRWNKMTTPLHLLAYALSLRYYSSEILDIPGRVPPYRDPEVAVGYKRELNRLFSDPDVASNVRRESVDFVSDKNAEPDAINDQSRLDPIGWWYLDGECYMYLQPLAIKILSQAIMKNLPKSDMIERSSVAGPGFVNIVLSDVWIAERIRQMLQAGISTWAPVLPITKAVVDFSSPNIAKEMHVGHLRSTIIGDCLARMLEFCKVEVLRRNHVGDWGTQFGMLIEYLFEELPNWEELGEQAIGDLQIFYKASKQKFDEDTDFKERAQQAVVRLQGGEDKYLKAWNEICDVSRKEFDQVYKRLKVQIEEKGESFYNPYIPKVLNELDEKGLIKESEGAKVIFIEGQKIPLIVVKRDGGFNYASTDMAALKYRLNEENAQWIVYVTDVGQSLHFEMVFSAAKQAGWLPITNDVPYPKARHVGFGLVLGADGKRFRTRSTELVRLVDLLDEAKHRSKEELIKRGKEDEWTPEELENAAEAIGYGAVKYADLKNNRLTNYTFNFDQMLDVRGNTAVYLLYAHARICSIIRKSGKDIEELKKAGRIQLIHENERLLGMHLIQFSEIVEDACTELLPNTLCEYLYNLSENFSKFYQNCKVVGSEEETSRLLLCEATAIVIRECFKLLGITPLYKL